ncbi:hypothetical protein O3689_02365 [Prevotella nigrescens]
MVDDKGTDNANDTGQDIAQCLYERGVTIDGISCGGYSVCDGIRIDGTCHKSGRCECEYLLHNAVCC